MFSCSFMADYFPALATRGCRVSHYCIVSEELLNILPSACTLEPLCLLADVKGLVGNYYCKCLAQSSAAKFSLFHWLSSPVLRLCWWSVRAGLNMPWSLSPESSAMSLGGASIISEPGFPWNNQNHLCTLLCISSSCLRIHAPFSKLRSAG